MIFMDYITGRDHSLMRRVNRWLPPRWIRLWAVWATRAGDGWLWWSVGLLVLIFGGEQRIAAVGSAVMAAGVGVVIFRQIKRTTGRRRPMCFEPHCWTTLLPPDRFSFPSGHTITAFSVALSLSHFYPGLAIGLVFCAVSVGASRIVLGMHFLSDVIAGAAIGTGLALTATWFLG